MSGVVLRPAQDVLHHVAVEVSPGVIPGEAQDTVQDAVQTGTPLQALGVALAAAGVGFLLAVLVGVVVRRGGRASEQTLLLSRRARAPLRVTMSLLGALVVLVARPGEESWRTLAVRVTTIALIAAVAWLVAALAFWAEDAALDRYRMDVVDNRHVRRVRTQVVLLRRLTVAAVVVLGAAAVLLTFPSARGVGASIVASAGVLGVVLGVAAQTTLSNAIAGFQLAFSDAVRVDDVVVVEDEWGRIEDLTLTHVVVHVWDDRRLVLPCTYFTSTPYENWTRRDSDVIGTVEMDVDWSVPVEQVREELGRVVHRTELWDGRVAVVQVTGATGSFVRLRALVSSTDGPTLFDLRCHVREALVSYLRREHPSALPRLRVSDDPLPRPSRTALPERDPDPSTDQYAALFRGDRESEERARAFSAQARHERAERTGGSSRYPDPDDDGR